jgi:SAM-dependent methyltransferase
MTAETTALPFALAPGEIEAVFSPFLVERLAADDPRWVEASERLAAKYLAPPKTARKWTTEAGVRTADLVRRGYEDTWARVSLERELQDSKTVPFEWRGEGLLARAMGRKRVHQLFLVRVLQWLRPQSVLEVGSGYGLNLLLLSMQFPDIRFLGVELTQAGVAATKALADDPSTPDRLAPFAIEPLADRQALRRLDVRHGSADALPLPDGAVDVAVTVLALEQMERIRAQALRELARVARHHVVMIEPFADWNAEGHRLEYIRRHDYFAARVDELPRYGLRPVVATADMPNKLTFRAGLVVAAVERQGA